MSKGEKMQLDSEPDLKKRTLLSLDLMEARMKRAEDLGTRNLFSEMYTELGGFHALMDNALEILIRNGNNNSKSLNNFKKFEIGIRAFVPRLEIIRRDLPVNYEPYVRSLIKYIRQARTKASEPLFSDTVVPNKKP